MAPSMEDIQFSDAIMQQNATICQDSLCILKLRSEDGKIFGVSDGTLRQSMLLAGLLEESSESLDVLSGEIISMPLCRQMLKPVLQYCAYHADNHDKKADSEVVSSNIRPVSAREILSTGIEKLIQRKIPPLNNLFKIDQWDESFIKTNWRNLIEILKAADYLVVTDLTKLILQSLAGVIAAMDPYQIQEFLVIGDDLTDKEKAAIVKTFPWEIMNKGYDIRCARSSSRARESSLVTNQRPGRTERGSRYHPYIIRPTLPERTPNVEV